MMTATPCLSYWGRPARPIICSTSVMGKSTYRLRAADPSSALCRSHACRIAQRNTRLKELCTLRVADTAVDFSGVRGCSMQAGGYRKTRQVKEEARLDGASKNSVPLMTTRWAGVLTPHASVDVATSTCAAVQVEHLHTYQHVRNGCTAFTFCSGNDND